MVRVVVDVCFATVRRVAIAVRSYHDVLFYPNVVYKLFFEFPFALNNLTLMIGRAFPCLYPLVHAPIST